MPAQNSEYPLLTPFWDKHNMGDRLTAFHRGQLVVNHALLGGQRQISILPEH